MEDGGGKKTREGKRFHIKRERMLRDISNTPKEGQRTTKPRTVEELEDALFHKYKYDLACGGCNQRGTLVSKGKVGAADAKRMGLKCTAVMGTGLQCAKTVVLHIALAKLLQDKGTRERGEGGNAEEELMAAMLKELEQAHQARSRAVGAQGNKSKSPRGLLLTPLPRGKLSGVRDEGGMGKENEVSGGGNAQSERSARGSGREREGILPGFVREKGREPADFPPGITTLQMTPKGVERGEKGTANVEGMEGMEVEENAGGEVNRKKRRASDLYEEEEHYGDETTEDEGGSGKKARGEEDEIERDMRGCSDEAFGENPFECEERGCFVDFHDQCRLCKKSFCFDHHWKHYCRDDDEEEEGAMEVDEEEELLAPTQLVAPEGDPEEKPAEEVRMEDVPLLRPVGLLAREEPTPPKEAPTQGLERQMEAMMKLMLEMRTDNIKLIMRVQDLERSSAAREGRRIEIEGGVEESKSGRTEEDKEDWEDPVRKREDPVGKKGAGEVRRPPPPGQQEGEEEGKRGPGGNEQEEEGERGRGRDRTTPPPEAEGDSVSQSQVQCYKSGHQHHRGGDQGINVGEEHQGPR